MSGPRRQELAGYKDKGIWSADKYVETNPVSHTPSYQPRRLRRTCGPKYRQYNCEHVCLEENRYQFDGWGRYARRSSQVKSK